jgi:WD40 repeat protein
MGTSGLTVWDLGAEARSVQTVPGGGRQVWFTRDGRALTTAGAAGVTRYAFQADGEAGPRLVPAHVWRSAKGIDHWWSADRTLLAVPTQSEARVYECATGRWRFTVEHTNMLEYMAFSPDNRWLAGGAWKAPHVKVWDAATGAVAATLETPPTARPVFAPAGGGLVVGTGAAYQFYAPDTWRPGLRIPREDCGQTPGWAAFSPDGTVFAGWSRRGVVALWDPRDGRELVSLPITVRTGSFGTHGELRFSADGRRLTVVADNRHIQLWDIAAIREQLATVGLEWSGPRAPE